MAVTSARLCSESGSHRRSFSPLPRSWVRGEWVSGKLTFPRLLLGEPGLLLEPAAATILFRSAGIAASQPVTAVDATTGDEPPLLLRVPLASISHIYIYICVCMLPPLYDGAMCLREEWQVAVRYMHSTTVQHTTRALVSASDSAAYSRAPCSLRGFPLSQSIRFYAAATDVGEAAVGAPAGGCASTTARARERNTKGKDAKERRRGGESPNQREKLQTLQKRGR